MFFVALFIWFVLWSCFVCFCLYWFLFGGWLYRLCAFVVARVVFVWVGCFVGFGASSCFGSVELGCVFVWLGCCLVVVFVVWFVCLFWVGWYVLLLLVCVGLVVCIGLGWCLFLFVLLVSVVGDVVLVGCFWVVGMCFGGGLVVHLGLDVGGVFYLWFCWFCCWLVSVSCFVLRGFCCGMCVVF